MECPFCSHEKTKVTNKRAANPGIRRRRECLNPKCKKRFTTYEKIDHGGFYIIKKDGSREPFDREKLERGVNRSFEKRPVPKEKVQTMLNEVEDALRKKGKKELKSSLIGDLVMKKIKKLDKVAYVRFASVYLDFDSVKDFAKEVKKL